MKRKNLSLSMLKVQSFVTSVPRSEEAASKFRGGNYFTAPSYNEMCYLLTCPTDTKPPNDHIKALLTMPGPLNCY